MASWSKRRKLTYAGIVGVLFVAAVVVPAFLILYTPPSCTDGILNGKEQGVDCGGSCERLCPSAFLAPEVSWTRFEQVAPGLYNLAAYIQNPNTEAEAQAVPYRFMLYDARGVLITERRGTVTLPPHRNTVAFLGAVDVGQRIPAKALFDFTGIPDWRKKKDTLGPLIIGEKNYEEDEIGSALTVTLENPTIYPLGEMAVYAVLYDVEKNAIGFSKTVVDGIAAQGRTLAPFTWPVNRNGRVISIEVLPVVE